VRCPVQSLWATRDDPDLFGTEPPQLWRGWAEDLRGAGIDSGHHVAEEAPEATAAALTAFWAEVGWT
jgi:haloacetate dehalogenase